VPPGLLTDGAELQAPPAPVPPLNLLPGALPDAWQKGRTTALSIAAALSQRAGRPLPWVTVRDALDAAFRARLLERTPQSGPWPSDFTGASTVCLQLPEVKTGTGAPGGPGTETGPPPNTRVSTELVLKANQLQDLSDLVPELLRAAAGQEIGFTVRVAIKGKDRPKDDVIRAINELLKQVDAGFEVV
jgi:hypothetical protein